MRGTNLQKQGRVRVDIGTDKEGNALILLHIEDNIFGFSPPDAAALSGQIQCMVASIWGVKAWKASAAKTQSDHTEEKIIPFNRE